MIIVIIAIIIIMLLRMIIIKFVADFINYHIIKYNNNDHVDSV